MKRKMPREISLFAQINISIILLVCLIFVAICFFLSRSFLYPSVEKDLLLNREATRQISEFMNLKYSAMYSQTKLIHNKDQLAEQIVGYASSSGTPVQRHNNLRSIRHYCYSLLYSDDDILDAVLISADGELLFSVSANHAHLILPGYSYRELPFVHELSTAARSILLTYMDAQPYAQNTCPTLTFGIRIRDPRIINHDTPIAYLLVSYPISVFRDVYGQLGRSSGGSIYVTDEENRILFSTEESAQGAAFDRLNMDASDITRSMISTSGLTLINAMPKGYLQRTIAEMVGILLLIFLPSLLVISVSIILLNRKYQLRINDLENTMSNYNTGGSYTPIRILHNDELGRLADQLNIMCRRLDAQIRLQYEAELGRKNAEINALQAQINPHFLFNTIESIRMRSIEDNDIVVAEMLTQLGQLFHWLIRLDRRIVCLEDEIDYNEAYLNLQHLRYEDSFESTFDVDNALLYLGIPKFTLQPVIENALMHGLHENGICGQIRIEAHRTDDNLCVSVSDNGSGMDAETLLQLQNHVDGTRIEPDMGIGLRNLQDRIHLLFGSSYGVQISSRQGAGTTVRILLPAMEKKQMEQYIQEANDV